MIQIYDASNTNYNMNGDRVIFPISCEVNMILNGTWELTLTHPIDEGGDFKIISEGNVICCPTPVSKRQLFRIHEKVKTDTLVTAYARPVFFDAAHDAFLLDVRPTDKTGQQALDIITQGTKYRGKSDITDIRTAYYERKNLIEAIQGDKDNSFISRWGGEPIFDNYTIIINQRAGGDYGVKAEFGRNLKSIEESVDMDGVITRIVPVSYNGYMLSGDSPWVDSPNIGKYPIIYTSVVKFEDIKLQKDCSGDEKGYETLAELQDELVRRCNVMFDSGCDVPKINYKINMIDLAATEEYKDYAVLETVSLGDTIHCRHRKLDITTASRVIRIKYDCIRERNMEEELGDMTYDYFQAMESGVSYSQEALSSILNRDDTIRGDLVKGVLNAVNVQLKYQKDVAQKQDVRAILFEDTDPNSPTYGALSIGTMGIQIADKRTADGRDWSWTTAITAKGGFADIFVAGYMCADRIRGGTLKMGGDNNINGEISIFDALGVQVGRWNKDGITATRGTLAGWNINEKAIYKDIDTIEEDEDGNEVEATYRIYIQPPLKNNTSNTWVLSCQRKGDADTSYRGNFILYASGAADFGKTKINKDGEISAHKIISKDLYNNQVILEASAMKFYHNGSYIGKMSPYAGSVIGEGGSAIESYVEFSCAVGATYFYNTSDERLKKIGEWDEKYDAFLMEVEPIQFEWNNGIDPFTHTGVGAQSIQKLADKHGIKCQLVHGNEEKSYSVAYSEFHAIEIASIQKNRKKIEELETKLENAENVIKELQETMKRLTEKVNGMAKRLS